MLRDKDIADIPYLQKEISEVVFDTNILRYSNHPVFLPQIEKFLEKFVIRNARFLISAVSIFELLQAANETIEKENIVLLSKFDSFPLNKKLLIVAARLAGIYQKYGGINLRGFGSGDLYIAATSITISTYILTANQKDYPHPIFQEEESFVISNKDKFGRTEYTSIYLLKPNYEFLADKLITN